jgi:16S rRNA (cytidine1402-2'-O)-methyltransferase
MGRYRDAAGARVFRACAADRLELSAGRYTAISLPATLYLVATPIGNLEDITLRALRVLREEATLIACEDTRQTQKLLDHFQIRKPTVSYHEHNENSRTPELLDRLEQGDNIALVSDAGTPLVSDPGYRLVDAAVKRGIPVVPLPGASAALAALSASALPPNEFRFVGFLPAKSGARRRFLEHLQSERMTVIAYESPHRILDALADMADILPANPLVLARELTKIHEEFLRGAAAEILENLKTRPVVKGEITLVIGAVPQPSASGDPLQEVARLQAGGMGRMDALKAVARQFGLSKRELYKMVEERR